MNPTLSVIIPIYRVEDYLERCVKSVLKQDYRDIEVILVDDGSPDRCPQICDELAKTDERIVVIHKSNGGLSSARNAGIEVAKGEYLAFLDSDDQWVEGRLKVLMDHVLSTNVDMLIYNSINMYDDGTLMKTQLPDFVKKGVSIYRVEKIYSMLIENGNLHEQAGTHIIKREIVISNALYYKLGLLGEDTEWMLRTLRNLEKIAVSDVYLQIYTAGRPGSITRSTSTKNVQDLIDIISNSLEFYSSNQKAGLKKFELAHCAYLWSTALGLFRFVADKDKVFIKYQLKRIRKQLNLNNHPKSRLVGIVYSLLGFELTCNLLGVYINLHRKNLINKKIKVKNV